MPIHHVVGIYLFVQTLTTFFLKDIMKGITDYNERIKVRFTVRLCLLFLVFTVSVSHNIYLISIHGFMIVLGFILVNIAIPFVIKYTNSVYLPAKVFLLGAFTCIALNHLIIGNPEGVGVILWYIVIILSASFILGTAWSLFYTMLALGMIAFLNITTHLEVELFGQHVLEGLPRVLMMPFRVGLPMFFLFFIAKDFMTAKEEAETQAAKLLSSQKELTATIADKENQYRTLIEEADDMIYDVDAAGLFKYINPAGLKLIEYTEKEAIRKKYDLFIVDSDKNQLRAAYINQVKQQEKNAYYQFQVQTKTGKLVWIGQKTKMFFDEQGKLIKSFCIGRNITEQKAAALALEKAKDEAIKHNRMKDSFMSTISHELKTPLNAVIAMSHNLLENDPRLDQKEDLGVVLFSANNLLTIVNNILDFSLLETGSIKIKEREFNLNTTLLSVTKAREQQLDNKNIKIQLQADTATPARLFGGVDKLVQVLNNLIQNAIKFTHKGQISLITTLLKETTTGVTMYFEVKDTGIGISNSKLDTIFERFTQIDASLNRNYGGTGLGLTIVKKLLQQMNGEIQVKSEVGKGSSFFFTLSFKKPLIPIKKQLALAPSASSMNSLAGIQVLLVEDNKINQLVAKKFLLKWKTLIDVADNGQIAVEKFKQKKYDLVLMDLEMPVMNGFESTKAIRALASGKDVPIIAVTASAVTDLVAKLQDYEFTDLVRKPFVPKNLYDKMVEHYEITKEETSSQMKPVVIPV